jgi:hypothetical protein
MGGAPRRPFLRYFGSMFWAAFQKLEPPHRNPPSRSSGIFLVDLFKERSGQADEVVALHFDRLARFVPEHGTFGWQLQA